MTSDLNPYRTPEHTGKATPFPNDYVPNRLAIALVVIGFIAYNAFACWFVVQGGPDRIPGLMLLINSPFMMFWLTRLIAGQSGCIIGGIVVAGVQVVIALAMLFTGVSAFGPAVNTNGFIAGIALVLTAICKWLVRPVDNQSVADFSENVAL